MMSSVNACSSSALAAPYAASIDAGREPGRSVARIPRVRFARDRCSADDARGEEVSPSGFLQNDLIQRQVGDRTAKPLVLFFQVLHPSRLLGSLTANLLASPAMRLFGNTNPAARIACRAALRQ
jgi:hypothetical protein